MTLWRPMLRGGKPWLFLGSRRSIIEANYLTFRCVVHAPKWHCVDQCLKMGEILLVVGTSQRHCDNLNAKRGILHCFIFGGNNASHLHLYSKNGKSLKSMILLKCKIVFLCIHFWKESYLNHLRIFSKIKWCPR